MKKIFAMLLSLVLVLSLCACGEKADDSAAQADSSAPETEQTEKTDETEPAAEADDAEETDEAEEADEEDGGMIAGMANPYTDYESLDEINAIVGGALCHPAVMGVTDETFCTIDCGDYMIAQYVFSLNGVEYCFRNAAVADVDISGCYVADGTAFEGREAADGIDYVSTEEYKLARWFDIGGQYVLMVTDNDTMDQEIFAGIAEELSAMTGAALANGED